MDPGAVGLLLLGRMGDQQLHPPSRAALRSSPGGVRGGPGCAYGISRFPSSLPSLSKRFKNSHLTVEETGAEVKYFLQSWNILVWSFLYIFFCFFFILPFMVVRVTAGLIP